MNTTDQTAGMKFLSIIRQRIDQIRADVPRLTALAEKMTKPLLAGGGLFNPNIGTYWPSEFGGRAGGLMGLKSPEYIAQSPNDLAFTTLPDVRSWKPAEHKAWQTLINSPAQIVVIGREEDATSAPPSRFLGFTGGAAPDDGLYAKGEFRPFAPLRPFEQLVRGWLTAGEMVAALTRAGKMPILWMSVWLEGALPRNANFFKHDNMREPWYAPLFHDSIYIPPLAAGYPATAFLAELDKIFNLVLAQSAKLATAGQWCADAIKAKKKISTVLVGHSYPQILENSEGSDYPIAWLPSISDLTRASDGACQRRRRAASGLFAGQCGRCAENPRSRRAIHLHQPLRTPAGPQGSSQSALARPPLAPGRCDGRHPRLQRPHDAHEQQCPYDGLLRDPL